MQVPPQLICEPGHETWHVPALQTWPATHAVPSLAPAQSVVAPQYPRSVCGSMQVPPQLIWPPGQDTWQVPPLQTWPEMHAAPALPPAQSPDAPQWARSVCALTHVPPQLICVPGHDVAHVPLLHTSPEAQAVPALAPTQWVVAPQ
jgi:hypothetical protein